MSTYEAWLHSRGYSARTIDQRLSFEQSRLRDWGTWDVPTDTIGRWLAGFAGWSRRTYHNNLISVYDWRVEDGLCAANPARTIRRTPTPRPHPKPLSEHQLRDALAAASGDTRTFLMLGYLQGLRAHEIAKFHGRDLDEVGLYVTGKGGQGHMLPTHPLIWELAVMTYPRDNFWFPSVKDGLEHIASATVTKRVGALFRSLGIEGASHRARHSFGTTLLRGGANLRVVQDLMRHSSLATTALYLGVDEDERRRAILGLAS